jgi:hypothetical protein
MAKGFEQMKTQTEPKKDRRGSPEHRAQLSAAMTEIWRKRKAKAKREASKLAREAKAARDANLATNHWTLDVSRAQAKRAVEADLRAQAKRMASGHKIKLGKGSKIKDGKVIATPYRLSKPAAYAKKTKKTYKGVSK